MKFSLPRKKSLLLISLIAAYIIFVFVLFLIVRGDDSAPTKIGAAPAPFVRTAVVSEQATVPEKVVAQKLDLQRKVLSARTPSEAARIRQIISSQGGTVLSSGSGSTVIVADVPKDKEEQVEKTLTAQRIPAEMEVDYPTFLSADNPDWGVKRIAAPDVWETTSASGIKIAVIDTGIDYRHPDLSGRYGGGYDTANGDSDPYDDHGHGTHVSGIVVSDLNGSGLAGVAPGGTVLGVKALGADGSGYISDLVEAIDWAMNNGAQIINYSLGTSYNSSILEEKINQAASRGIIQVAAAGNTSGGALLYPAAYGAVISVSATDSSDNIASFSSLGAEIAAPGVAVTSTVPGGGYATWSGTSMAAPHVTATVALMLANKQTDIRKSLQDTAIDLGPSGVDTYYGYGLVHAKPAALGEDTLAPLITFLSPENNANVSGIVDVSLSFQDEYKIASASLFLNNQKMKDWTAEPYTYSWNTAGLMDGTYELRAESYDENGNKGEAKITVTIGEVTPTPTKHQMQQQGESQAVRQDINQEQAQQHRQDYQHVPQSPQEASANGQTQQSAPEVSNINERNQKPQESQGQGSGSENGKGNGKKDVQGASDTSWWQLFLSNLRSFLGGE